VAPKWLLGLKYGINFTFPAGTYKRTDPSRGSQPGVILEYALTKDLSVSIHTAYTSLRFQDQVNSITHHPELVYVEIPVLLNYKFLKGNLRPYLQIGLFSHYLIDANNVVNVSEPEPVRENIKNEIRPFNWGFWVGAGIGLDIKAKGFWFRPGIEVNYKHGFRNIVNKNYNGTSDLRVRNFEISLKLLYSIYRTSFRK
jgi:hypothetical protein